jgi:hypothetical protein
MEKDHFVVDSVTTVDKTGSFHAFSYFKITYCTLSIDIFNTVISSDTFFFLKIRFFNDKHFF